MNILEKMLGGGNRIKVMRLFLVGPEKVFTKDDISEKTRTNLPNVQKEVSLLWLVGFIKKKKIKIEREGGGKIRKFSTTGWKLNQDFKYLSDFRTMLLDSDVIDQNELLKKLKGVGKIRLVIAAGVFINSSESRADLLVVGDDIDRKSLDKIMKAVESKIGRDLNYGVFDTEDFKYRLTVYDKFVRDILDFPNKKILDKMHD